MTITTPSTASTAEQANGAFDPPPSRRRRWMVIGVTVLVIAGAAGGYLALDNGPTGGGGVADNADPTATTSVVQENLTSQTQVSATLGYSGSYSVLNQAQGTITWLPAVGQVVTEGQVLYDVNGSPVVLLDGATPAYRTLSEGASSSDVTGADVEDLNYDLVAKGYLTSAEVGSATDEFGSWTKVGVEKLQAALGETQNGTLTLGQVVFLPGAARITALGTNTTLGGSAQPGSTVLTATSTARVVTIDLDAAQQSSIAVGDDVTITLPDNETTPGKVTSVGTVATTPSDANDPNASSNPTITVLVTPTDPSATGDLDQAPVEVSITTNSVNHAFAVPVDALLALANGGDALEVIGPRDVHTLEPVTTGLFDDASSMVAVSGPGVQAGQRIVVPAT